MLDETGEFYVADFIIWQQEHFWNQDQEGCTPGVDCDAYRLWGWMDAPALNTFDFLTCDPLNGFPANIYDAEFRAGRVFQDVLNFPGDYISGGDWVSSEPFIWSNVDDVPTLTLDFEVQR